MTGIAIARSSTSLASSARRHRNARAVRGRPLLAGAGGRHDDAVLILISDGRSQRGPATARAVRDLGGTLHTIVSMRPSTPDSSPPAVSVGTLRAGTTRTASTSLPGVIQRCAGRRCDRLEVRARVHGYRGHHEPGSVADCCPGAAVVSDGIGECARSLTVRGATEAARTGRSPWPRRAARSQP
ncbi:hypothetical protein I551_8801 [Mycobacterium ulcerans str. Harvey]|uniref:VWFA domain-containing protein n=1 Tax=Mycobacterium ulcerans str. Harvey TaxID=1299332 RepID=A0ABP3AVH1_MYCUL|nr:hypothetical protein I551_8801 [Mycobacterium ulcerans str. Harvey]